MYPYTLATSSSQAWPPAFSLFAYCVPVYQHTLAASASLASTLERELVLLVFRPHLAVGHGGGGVVSEVLPAAQRLPGAPRRVQPVRYDARHVGARRAVEYQPIATAACNLLAAS